MWKKCLVLAAAVSCLLISTATGRSQSSQPAAAQIKADVAKIGTGARVSVKLRDRKRFTGYVSVINEQDFVITKAKEGTRQGIAYTDVAEVKVKNEKRVSTAGKVLIVLGAMWVVGVIATGGGG